MDGFNAGGRPDELMQPPELVNSGKGGDLQEQQQLISEPPIDLSGAAVHEVTSMLQDADLKEQQQPHGQAFDLNATAVHHQMSNMQATMQSTPAPAGVGQQFLNVSARALDQV